MANFTALKTAINNAIKTNGNEEITGAILQAILDAMVETLGDSAITDLENALTTEVTNRENAVGDVATDLAAEALARANKDNQLDNRINQEEYNRQNADAALSQTMSQGFQTLGSQMTALNAAISALNAAYQNGYLYGGIATPSSSPSNNKCFYIALQGGTYTNFGGVGVVEGINIIKNDSGWKVEHIYDQTTLLNEFHLLRQQVIQAITSFAPIVIEGDVTNAPDEEDLTSNANHLLQFKNNAYSPLEFSGLGRKYLRKNIAPLSESAPFNGFVEGVTAEETLSGTPTQIFWDRMNTRFVGVKDGIYYAAWTDDDNYVPVSTSLVYMYNGTPYQWTGSDFIVDETEVPNLVNCLTQDMINEANTIYIIRYDYTLKENIIIPDNCVLQFDGGSISGNFSIDFTNLLQTNIYASWMTIDVMLNSIQYMSNKTLVIDKDIVLTRPISFNDGVHNLGYFNIVGKVKQDLHIAGIEDREYGKPVVTCKNCSAIDLWNYSPYISNIIFHKDDDDDTTKNLPIIYLHGTNHSNDLDARIDNCSFRGQGDSAITTYGRGLEIKNCGFAFATFNNQAAINCYLTKDTSSFYPSSVDRRERYAGRAFLFHNNRIHITVSNFVWFHVNEDTPTSCFEGIRIFDNLADTGSNLCRIDAPNYDTYIGNNTFIGGVDVYTPYFIKAVDSENLQIVSNVFSGLENDDRPDYKRNYMRISLGLRLNAKIKNVSILNNIIQTDAYFIETDSDIDGLQIINNIFTKQSFTRDNNPILLRATGSLKNVIIKNNVNQSSVKPKTLLFGGDVTGKDISNVIIESNSNLYNYFHIFYANLSDFTYSNNISGVNETEWGNMNAKEKIANHASSYVETKIKFIDYVGNERYFQGRRSSTPMAGNSTPTPALPMSTEDIGQSILDDSVGYHRPMWYNGGVYKWLDALGRTKAILFGKTTERPTNLNGEGYNIGFLYFDTTLGKPIWYKGKENNVDIWVDATGATV